MIRDERAGRKPITVAGTSPPNILPDQRAMLVPEIFAIVVAFIWAVSV
jgi:hypothetical protein